MTILFQKDWTDDRGRLRAVPHISTKNKSFLRTCMVLKKMGIKNHYFPLTLYDPDLKDVDVHDLEENTPENEHIRTKVQIEARRNVWYYLRECIRIYEQGGDPVPFRLDRGSCAMTWCFINGIDYTCMQPRQAQPLDAIIRVSEGASTMGVMSIGKEILVPDGRVAKVKGVYPQGVKDVYKITFEDDRSTECCDDHLWKVHWTHWGETGGGKWRIYTLKEIRLHTDSHTESHNNLYIPLIEPEIKDDIDLPLDPYILGVILGNGSIGQTITICKPDQFIKDEVSRLLPDYAKVSEWYSDKKCFGIADKERSGRHGKSRIRKVISDLGLDNTLSDTKFIPEIYMTASPRQRLALVQGLMDTDGTVGNHRFCKDGITRKHEAMEYSTTSLSLAMQFQELIRSLGGLCKFKERQTYYTYKNQKLPGKLSYRLWPRVKDRTTMFRLPRKKDLTTLGNHKYQDSLKLAIKSIEYIGKKEVQCIEVDHPDHLYITNDYIVTHNTGKTVAALSLSSWIVYSSGKEYTLGMMTKDDSLRRENVKRVKAFGENLPAWWLSEDKNKDKKNSDEILYAALGTHYITFVAQTEPSAADRQARGISAPSMHFDEFDYIKNIGISYPTALSSTDAARQNAKKNGKPYSNILTTTAGDPSKPECKEAAKLLSGAMPFTELLYDLANTEELHNVVKASSPQKMIIGVFSHLQLGYDNAWLIDKITRNRLTRDQVMRDYLNRRVSIQENPIIPKDILATITSSQRDVSYIQQIGNGFVIFWYLPKEVVHSEEFKQKTIVLGCDSSEMIGRDSTTLIGVDPTDLGVVCSFRCNEGNLNVVGVMIARLMMMFPKIILVPENKSSGTAFIDTVSLMLRKEGHNPFKRIFNWIVNNRHEKEFSDIDIRDTSLLDTVVKKYFGIKTDKTKRDELYSSTLITSATMACRRIRDQNLIQELNSLTTRNGRVDHAAGGNDDSCIAWLMAMWFILNAKHLDIYGIKPGTNMNLITHNADDPSKRHRERQETIKAKIDELEKGLRGQQDPMLRKLLQADLSVLRGTLDSGPMLTPLNADELIRDPRKYTDAKVAEESRPRINMQDMENSLKAILNL